jgi:hypothetical protein
MKIVNPTIIRPFREKIDDADGSVKKLKNILKELQSFKVLDPACGSGNFLYLAFLELRNLEFEVRTMIEEGTSLLASSSISLKNFYGIDTNHFGLELAKVALSIGRKISADKYQYKEDVLPFENLNDHFFCEDALFIEWPQADAIIGNPPFLGGNSIAEEYGVEYSSKLQGLFSEVSGQPDYCVYWFRLACKSNANFFGLVGTNSISQGVSRLASLEYIVNNSGLIHDAVSTQEWSGDAAVHVSIVNWSKIKQQKLFLDGKIVDHITSSLKTDFSVIDAKRLEVNGKYTYEGISPKGSGFLVSEALVKDWIKQDKRNANVLKQYLSAKDLTDSPQFLPSRWAIDFNDMSIEDASVYKLPLEHVRKFVKPVRDKVRREAHKKFWWHFGEKRPGMRKALSGFKKFITVPIHSKWCIHVIVNNFSLPNNSVNAIASDDFYSLGLLTSKLHRDWVTAQASTLKGDTRYTNTTCFETFPFLWDVPEKLKIPVREVTKRLDDFRLEIMKEKNYGITKLYNEFFNEPTSQLFTLHRELDDVVCRVYGWKWDPNKNYNEQLYNLNQELWQKEQVQLELKPESKKGKKKTKE